MPPRSSPPLGGTRRGPTPPPHPDEPGPEPGGEEGPDVLDLRADALQGRAEAAVRHVPSLEPVVHQDLLLEAPDPGLRGGCDEGVPETRGWDGIDAGGSLLGRKAVFRERRLQRVVFRLMPRGPHLDRAEVETGPRYSTAALPAEQRREDRE